ncbi:uncharacterized protein BN565_00122 [Clostridium sp. CAG:253]|nr:uncharacterized protein BN565_00122 [Clostridium sp. CAG:253]
MTRKVALITGGASGLGRTLMEEFIKADYDVCFTYMNSEKKAKCYQEKYGDRVLAIKADASVYDAACDVVKSCIDKFKRIDVLVNNAASAKDGSVLKLEYNDFDYTIKNVLYPVFNYTKATVPYLIKNTGKIINIGSINGLRGREGSLAYSTAKAGIEGFTKTIAKELGFYNICCNVVAPGFINTDGQANTSELIKKMVKDECVIKKLTEPIEVANLVLFLAGDKSNNITGQVYKIDCGQYI